MRVYFLVRHALLQMYTLIVIALSVAVTSGKVYFQEDFKAAGKRCYTASRLAFWVSSPFAWIRFHEAVDCRCGFKACI